MATVVTWPDEEGGSDLTRRTKDIGTGKKSIRQRIATALVYERLGLDGDWNDPEFEITLPTTLPSNKGHKLSSHAAREIEAWLGNLVALGCHKNGLYWCLAQLGSDAEDARQGKRLILKLDEDENKNRAITINPAMATQQDMKSLINNVGAAAKIIRRYRDELLLVAEVCRESIDLPGGLLTEPELPEESMAVLLQSLSWAKKLALEWESPNPTALLKSKGILFFARLRLALLHSRS